MSLHATMPSQQPDSQDASQQMSQMEDPSRLETQPDQRPRNTTAFSDRQLWTTGETAQLLTSLLRAPADFNSAARKTGHSPSACMLQDERIRALWVINIPLAIILYLICAASFYAAE